MEAIPSLKPFATKKYWTRSSDSRVSLRRSASKNKKLTSLGQEDRKRMHANQASSILDSRIRISALLEIPDLESLELRFNDDKKEKNRPLNLIYYAALLKKFENLVPEVMTKEQKDFFANIYSSLAKHLKFCQSTDNCSKNALANASLVTQLSLVDPDTLSNDQQKKIESFVKAFNTHLDSFDDKERKQLQETLHTTTIGTNYYQNELACAIDENLNTLVDLEPNDAIDKSFSLLYEESFA